MLLLDVCTFFLPGRFQGFHSIRCIKQAKVKFNTTKIVPFA